MRILVVDDDLDILTVTRYSLEKTAGVEVKTADSGKLGLQVAKEFKPEMVLLDLIMPEMNGVEFCIEFRKIAGCETVPVIFFTASRLGEEAAQSYRKHGALGVIHKPFDPFTLFSQIQKIIQR